MHTDTNATLPGGVSTNATLPGGVSTNATLPGGVSKDTDGMGLDQILANLPAVLIPIALVVYYTNQNNINWMKERTELVKAIMTERKEWLDWQTATIERQFDQQERRMAIQERVAVALEALKIELHTTRGKIQELMGRYELVATPKEPPQRGSDD